MGVSIDLLQNLRLKAHLSGEAKKNLREPCAGPKPYKAKKNGELEPLSLSLAREENKQVHDVFLDEGIARSSYLKVIGILGAIRTHEASLRKTTLPTKLSKLSSQVVQEESKCLKLMKKTAEMINQIAENNPEAGRTFENLRRRLSDLLFEDLAEAQEELVAMRSKRQQEFRDRTQRMLIYTFPEVNAKQVNEVMEAPELAADIIQHRLTYGDDADFETIHAKVSSSTAGLQRRLEAEALQIEIMFFQFSELVSKNDGMLSQIEENIQSTLQHTEDAIVNLKEANELKRGNQRRACMMKMLTWLAIMGLVWYFFGDEVKWALQKVGVVAEGGGSAPVPPPATGGGEGDADRMTQPGDQGVEPFLQLVDKNAKNDEDVRSLKAPASALGQQRQSATVELWAANDERWSSQAVVAAQSAARARAKAATRAQAAAFAQADAARADAEAATAEAVASKSSLLSRSAGAEVLAPDVGVLAPDAKEWPFRRPRGRHQAALESLRSSVSSDDKPVPARGNQPSSAGRRGNRNAIVAVFVERMENIESNL